MDKGFAPVTEARYVHAARQPMVCRHSRCGRLLVTLLSAAAGWFVPARAAETTEAELAELRQLAAELGVSLDEPTWQFGGDLEAGVGYGDNVLLSAVDPISSGFVRINAGGMAIRAPRHGFEWFNSADVTFTQYFSDDVDNGVFALGRSEARWRANDAWRFSAGLQAVHQDEVMDASSLDLGAARFQIKVTSLAFEPAAQWQLAPGWSARVQATAAADNFQQLDDYDELGGELTLARDLGRAGTWTLAAGLMDRDYETRPQATIGGGPVFDTILGVAQTRVELRYALKGGGEGKLRWRAKARVGLLDNDDNGEGWYNYRRHVAQGSFAIEGRRWRLETTAGWRRYGYDVQYAGFGIDPPRLWRDEWNVLMRHERDLREGVSAFLELEFEQGRSNDEFLRFRNTTAIIGLQLSR